MNKGEIRRRVLEQVDWQPDQSAAFKAKVDRLINRAYQQLMLEAPFLFFETDVRVFTESDVSSITAKTADRVSIYGTGAGETTDRYVLVRGPYTLATAGLQTWAVDGTWDGRRIECTRANGKVISRVCREFWQEEVSAGVYKDYVTVNHPWINETDEDMEYRIYTPEYDLPPDVVELRSARLNESSPYDLEIINQNDAERLQYTDFRGEQTGKPDKLFRGRHWQIDAPTVAAEVKHVYLIPGYTWEGPDPGGKFDYCFTYVWGKRNLAMDHPSDHAMPKWESAPSPISATIDHESGEKGTGAGSTVVLKLPNIDHELNFYKELSGGAITTPKRSEKSGLRIRIYVRRYSVGGTGSVERIESPEVFYLLAEVDGHATEYVHDGSDIPDYYVRLKSVHGYQSIRFHPHPDDAYTLFCRVLQRPQPLVNDQDAPRIHEEAADVLIQRVLAFFYEMNGNAELSQISEARYNQALNTLTKRYGMITGARVRKKFPRVQRPYRDIRVTWRE